MIMKVNSQNLGLWKKIGTKSSLRPQTFLKKEQLRDYTSQNIQDCPQNNQCFSFTDLQISAIPGKDPLEQMLETEDSFFLPLQLTSEQWTCSRCQELVTKNFRPQTKQEKQENKTNSILSKVKLIKSYVYFLKQEHCKVRKDMEHEINKTKQIIKASSVYFEKLREQVLSLQAKNVSLFKQSNDYKNKSQELESALSQIKLTLQISEKQNKKLRGFLDKKLADQIQSAESKLIRSKKNDYRKISSFEVSDLNRDKMGYVKQQIAPSEDKVETKSLQRYKSSENLKMEPRQFKTLEQLEHPRKISVQGSTKKLLMCSVEDRLKNLKKQIQDQMNFLQQ